MPDCLHDSKGIGISEEALPHARRIRDAHSRYPRFFEYGDAESYRKGLERLQKEYGESGKAD